MKKRLILSTCVILAISVVLVLAKSKTGAALPDSPNPKAVSVAVWKSQAITVKELISEANLVV